MTMSFHSDASAPWSAPARALARGGGVAAVCSFLHPLGFCWFPFGFSHLGRLWLIGSLLAVCVARSAVLPRELRLPVAASCGAMFLLGLALVVHLDAPEFWPDFIRLGF